MVRPGATFPVFNHCASLRCSECTHLCLSGKLTYECTQMLSYLLICLEFCLFEEQSGDLEKREAKLKLLALTRLYIFVIFTC